MGEMSFNTPRSITRIQRMQVFMKDVPRTVQDIADHLHISRRWVNAYLAHLRTEKKVHIKKWAFIEGQKHELYQSWYVWGAGADAVKPPAMSSKEKTTKRRAKLKEDIEEYDRQLIKRRTKRIQPHRDPYISAFFGSE